MTKKEMKKLAQDLYAKICEEEYTTTINTFDKPEYSPLDMRDDEMSFAELVGLDEQLTMGFKGKFAYLSNMSYAPFEMNGHWFLTAEHAYHFWKCKYKDEAMQFECSNPNSISDPYAARAAGHKVKIRDNWDQIKVKVMRNILEAKFSQNEYLLEKLSKETSGVICEYNTWGDKFWGKAKVEGHYEGRNELGKLLTELRDAYMTEERLEEEDINIYF